MSANQIINVRLPGCTGTVEVLVATDATPTMALEKVAADYNIRDIKQYSLVISPNGKNNGGILDVASTFRDFNLKTSDSLEMWKSPFLMSVCEQTLSGQVRNVKQLPLDYSLPLIHLVPCLQRCFDIGLEEVVFQSAVIDGGRASNAVWLNANESLQRQKFGGENCLVILRMEILEKMPARSLASKSTRDGWMTKESHKNDRLTPRKRRYCILRNSFMFYFKNKNDSHPAGVVPLEYYAAKKVVREPRGQFIVLRRAFKGFESRRADAFLFSVCEKGDSIDEWFQLVRVRCVNVADKLFGVPLARVVLADESSGNVPEFVSKCVAYLSQADVIRTEGLFRMSGALSAIQTLKDQFDQAVDVQLQGNANVDAHTVAGLFKLFFREMPEPLYPFSFFKLLLRSHEPHKPQAKKVYEMLHTTSQLPRCHYDVLKYLCVFLKRVSTFADANKMSVANLARVWASNIIRDHNTDPDAGVADIEALLEVTTSLIENSDQLYHVEDETVSRRGRAPTTDTILALPLNESNDDEDDPDRPEDHFKTTTFGAIEYKAPASIKKSMQQQQQQQQLPVATPKSPRAGGGASKVVKTGMLTKQGERRKNWKTRWFKLTSTQLAYFENQKAKTPKGVIALTRGVKVRVDADSKKSNCFALITATRTFYICAETHAEMKEWMEAISLIIDPPPPPRDMKRRTQQYSTLEIEGIGSTLRRPKTEQTVAELKARVTKLENELREERRLRLEVEMRLQELSEAKGMIEF